MSARHGASFAGSAACRAVVPVAAGVPGVACRGDQPVLIVSAPYCTLRLAMLAETPRNSNAAATCAQTGTTLHQCGLWVADSGLNCGFPVLKVGSGGDQRPSCTRTSRSEATSA